MDYLGNGFSLNMIEGDYTLYTRSVPLSVMKVLMRRAKIHCIIGHADTACLVSKLLGMDIPCNRETVSLKPGDALYVAQYKGPRLPEGATSLPEGAEITFKVVHVEGPLTPWPEYEPTPGSIYGALLNQSRQVADLVCGEAVVCKDSHGNFTIKIDAPHFSGRMWDE